MKNWTNSSRALAVAVVIPVLAAGCGLGQAEEAAPLQTVDVIRSDLRITAEATGQLEPIRRIEVKSKAGGEVIEMHADVGDEVEPGTLLAQIDPRDVENRWQQVLADLEVARVRAQIAEDNLARQERLHAQGIITDQEFEQARLDHTNQQASMVRVRSDSTLAAAQLNDVTIRAPMAGTILERLVEEGSVIQSASSAVSGGTALFTMASLDRMQVRTLVDETDMGEIEAGMEASVSVEAYPDRNFIGLVEKIEPQAVVQQNVTMFPVIVTLDNREGFLKPGMNSEVEILLAEAEDVIVVPNGAIIQMTDVLPAAAALGIKVTDDQMAALRSSEGRSGRGAGRSGGAAGDSTGAPSGDSATAPSGRGGRAARGGQGGGRSVDPARMAELRQAFAQRAGGRSGGRQGRAETQRVVVFVMRPDGSVEPRAITIGLSDWDFAQVVSGVEEGERLVVVGAAQLVARQQEQLERMRGGGGDPFSGGRGRR